MQHLKSTRDDCIVSIEIYVFIRTKTKMAQNKVIVELSVLDPNLTEESPGKENIDYTITTPFDQKKKLLGDGEKYTSLSNLSSFLHFKSETGAILFIDIVTQLFVFRIFVDVV